VAIDDFGCGFSNLSQHSQLTFHTLKIDRSLVESIDVDGKAKSVIKAIISMGHSLDHEISPAILRQEEVGRKLFSA